MGLSRRPANENSDAGAGKPDCDGGGLNENGANGKGEAGDESGTVRAAGARGAKENGVVGEKATALDGEAEASEPRAGAVAGRGKTRGAGVGELVDEGTIANVGKAALVEGSIEEDVCECGGLLAESLLTWLMSDRCILNRCSASVEKRFD